MVSEDDKKLIAKAEVEDLIYALGDKERKDAYTAEEIREASMHVGKYIDIGTRVVRCVG